MLSIRATARGLEVTVPTLWNGIADCVNVPEGLRAQPIDDGFALRIPGLVVRPERSGVAMQSRSETLLAERQELRHAVVLLKEREAELDRARAEFERSNADLERFAAAVSHDLKEPLSVISLYAEIVREQLDSDSMAYGQLETIVASVQSMRLMLDGLLTWSSVDAPEEAPTTRVQEAVDRALRNLHSRVREHDAVVDVKAPDEVAVADVHLVEVVQNLLANALKYRSKRRPLLRVRTTNEGGLVAVSVQDNGVGIAPQDQNRVFDLFTQSDPSAEGAGVGLALVARYAERYGGDVSVRSVLGEGSTFTVRLPPPA